MVAATMLVGTHMWFFREGDAFVKPAPGLCAAETDLGGAGNGKPGITPDFDAGWIDVGTVEACELTATQTDHKLWKPSPGRLVLKDLIETQQEMTGKITVNDVSPLAVETMFRTNTKLGGAQKQFVPLGAVSRKGWSH